MDISFIREGAPKHDGRLVELKPGGTLSDALGGNFYLGDVKSILLDNVTNLWTPERLDEELALAHSYMDSGAELIICDLNLQSFCNAISDNYLSFTDGARALYGRHHIYDINAVCDILEKLGFTIDHKRIDKLSFVIKAFKK